MKNWSRHIFALALLASLLAHLGLIGGGLAPALLSAFKTPPPPKVVNVQLRELSLDDAPPPVNSNLSMPPLPDVGHPPPGGGFHMPGTPPMPLGGGLRNHNGPSAHGNGLRLPGRHVPKSIFSAASARHAETSAPLGESADASAPAGRQAQQTAQADPAASEASQPNSNVATPNTRPPGAGGKPQGARDAQGMIVSSQNLGQALPNSARLTYLEKTTGSPGSMRWERRGHQYELTLTTKLTMFSPTIQYRSTGTIDQKNGLRPLTFTELRGDKQRRHARFDWGQRLLTYGDRDEQQTELKDGAQDLLSLSWQLALKAKLDGNTQLTNGSKVYEYPIRAGDGVVFDGDNGSIRAKTVVTHYDEQDVEVWLAADFANIPIRIIFKKPGIPTLDLQITGINLNGVDEWGRPDQTMNRRQK